MASIDRDSKEIRTLPVSTTDGQDLSLDTVEVAFVSPGTRPEPGDWKPCTWSTSTLGAVDVLFGFSNGFTLAPGRYHGYIRVTDAPEIPVLRIREALDVL